MKYFVVKILVFLLIPISLFLVGWFISNHVLEENFHYSILDKHNLLLNHKENPRILLVGGSNVSLGVFSPMLEDSLNVPVINTAIAGGYGLKYILDDIEPFIQKGDIVILIPEYSHFYDDFFYRGSLSLIRGLEACPGNLKLLSSKQVKLLINDIPDYYIEKVHLLFSFLFGTLKKSIYLRNSFNQHGDFVAHWNQQSKSFSPTSINSKSKYNVNTILYIQNFSKIVENKQAVLLLSFPSFAKTSFERISSQCDKIEKDLIKSRIPILGSPERYTFDDSLFYDTRYHLAKSGQLTRSQILIQDIKDLNLSQKFLE